MAEGRCIDWLEGIHCCRWSKVCHRVILLVYDDILLMLLFSWAALYIAMMNCDIFWSLYVSDTTITKSQSNPNGQCLTSSRFDLAFVVSNILFPSCVSLALRILFVLILASSRTSREGCNSASTKRNRDHCCISCFKCSFCWDTFCKCFGS